MNEWVFDELPGGGFDFDALFKAASAYYEKNPAIKIWGTPVQSVSPFAAFFSGVYPVRPYSIPRATLDPRPLVDWSACDLIERGVN